MISDTAAKGILTNLGFRVNSSSRYRQAIRDFQAGWNLGTALEIDGVKGEKTSDALTLSEKRRKAGSGTLSPNFSFKEFQCKCGGRYSSCRRINGEGDAGTTGPDKHVLRYLVQGLEVLRKEEYASVGLSIVSGYRCPGWNKVQKGASSSQHLFGGAADIAQRASTKEVKGLKKFSGIGYQGSTGKVRHVDVRSVTGHNTTSGSTTNPTIWKYA